MTTQDDGPPDFRYELYRSLYEKERDRRETLRASLSVPVAAMSIVLFGIVSLFRDAPSGLESGVLPGLAWASSTLAILLVLAACGALYKAEAAGRLAADVIGFDDSDTLLKQRIAELSSLGVGGRDAETRAIMELKADVTRQLYQLYLEMLHFNEERAGDRTHAVLLLVGAIIFVLIGHVCFNLAA